MAIPTAMTVLIAVTALGVISAPSITRHPISIALERQGIEI
jgi:hypothetical protein